MIKHIPGHGRATVDSHKALPLVEPMPMDLRNIDFAPFRALSRMPWAMTAHVVYRAVDAILPATTSTSVIGGVIRGSIRGPRLWLDARDGGDPWPGGVRGIA